ncbi:MAG: hypothetical protein FWC00_06180 [Firmicutes bacterium]|nr:hypothetical protein [Bacillota bacterium]
MKKIIPIFAIALMITGVVLLTACDAQANAASASRTTDALYKRTADVMQSIESPQTTEEYPLTKKINKRIEHITKLNKETKKLSEEMHTFRAKLENTENCYLGIQGQCIQIRKQIEILYRDRAAVTRALKNAKRVDHLLEARLELLNSIKENYKELNNSMRVALGRQQVEYRQNKPARIQDLLKYPTPVQPMPNGNNEFLQTSVFPFPMPIKNLRYDFAPHEMPSVINRCNTEPRMCRPAVCFNREEQRPRQRSVIMTTGSPNLKLLPELGKVERAVNPCPYTWM